MEIMPQLTMDSATDYRRVSKLQRTAELCRRLSTGAVPVSVIEQLAVLAIYCESEAACVKDRRE
jgi:hypothetical protein